MAGLSDLVAQARPLGDSFMEMLRRNALTQYWNGAGQGQPAPSGGPQWEAMVRQREAMAAQPKPAWAQPISDSLEAYIQRNRAGQEAFPGLLRQEGP